MGITEVTCQKFFFKWSNMVYAALRTSRKNIKLPSAICYFYKDRDRIIRAFLSDGWSVHFWSLKSSVSYFNLLFYYSRGLLLTWVSTVREQAQQFPSPVHQNTRKYLWRATMYQAQVEWFWEGKSGTEVLIATLKSIYYHCQKQLEARLK